MTGDVVNDGKIECGIFGENTSLSACFNEAVQAIANAIELENSGLSGQTKDALENQGDRLADMESRALGLNNGP